MERLLMQVDPAEDLDSYCGKPEDESKRLARTTDLTYKRLFQRFILRDKKYTQQFSHIYLQRLQRLKDAAHASAKEAWGNDPEFVVYEKVIELGSSTRGVILGTLYKEQKLRPSVMDEFVEEFTGKDNSAAGSKNYVSDGDCLVLEDESGRVTLTGVPKEQVDAIVSGVVAAVNGKLLETGEFQVDGICFPGVLPAPPRAIPNKHNNPVYTLFVSGLAVGANHDPLPLNLLTDYIVGHLGSEEDHKLQSSIARVVVVGGGVCLNQTTAVGVDQEAPRHFDEPLLPRTQKRFVAPVKDLDTVLSEWCSAVPVDVMPGKSDPASLCLPQQPLQKCLLPISSRFSTCQRVTNPYHFEFNGVEMLGHSGQPISDCMLYTQGGTPLDLLESTLRWQHIAPTAPDTLPAYPFVENDPFVLNNSPHLFFAGNQPAFATKVVNSTRLICVPSFESTGQVVLVDTASAELDCKVLSFDATSKLLNPQEEN